MAIEVPHNNKFLEKGRTEAEKESVLLSVEEERIKEA